MEKISNKSSQHPTLNTHHSEGISLITLIITIIVIIILASIVIFSGLNTPDRAGYAKFVSELEDVQTYVTNQIANEKGNNIIKGTVKSNAQLAYMVATGTTGSSVPASPTPAGTIASLGKTILPEGLQGTNYYEITNADVLSPSKSFYQTGEKHYITDKGEVFIWPGYLVEEDNGSKWYVNQKKYYTGMGASNSSNNDTASATDLANLRTYFIGKGWEDFGTYVEEWDDYWFPCRNIAPIEDASTSIILISESDGIYFQYHNHFYQAQFDENWRVSSVVTIEDPYEVTGGNGDFIHLGFFSNLYEQCTFEDAYVVVNGNRININSYRYWENDRLIYPNGLISDGIVEDGETYTVILVKDGVEHSGECIMKSFEM